MRKQRYNETVTLRLSELEKEKLIILSEKERMTVGEYIRMLIDFQFKNKKNGITIVSERDV